MKRNKFSKQKRRAGIGRRLLSGVALLGLSGVIALACTMSGDESSGSVVPKADTGTCMGDEGFETNPATGMTYVQGMQDAEDLNCTAMDVVVAETQLISGPVECLEGEVIEIEISADLESNSQSRRSDIGIWLDNEGGNAFTGSCTHFYFEDPALEELDDVPDMCRDIGGQQLFQDVPLDTPQATLMVTCRDEDNNGFLDVGSCIGWKVPGDDQICPNDADGNGMPDEASDFVKGTLPANKAKCRCGNIEIPIVVKKTATIEVKKEVPDCAPDPGLFNLQIDGNDEATDVGDGGTTGPVEASAGTNQDPGDDHTVGEVAGSGTDLNNYDTSIACTCTNETPNEACTAGIASTPGAGPLDVRVNPDDAWVCTITNEIKKGTINIKKVTVPPGGTDFGFTDDIEAPNAFMLDDGGTKTFLEVCPGSYMVTEDEPTPEFDLTDLTCVETVVNTTTSGLTANIVLDPDETVECTYTNTQRGMVDLLKLTNGVLDPNMAWSFTLNGPEVNVGDSTPPTLVDFDMAKLIPGETYTLCETGIPPSWTIQWALDANDNGIIDDGETLPFVGASTGALLEVYDPTFGEPGATNDTRCVDFTTMAAETLHFIIDNQRPGGEPRTPGYWKNWNTCTNGNQVQTAAGNGGVAEGWFLLDDLIPTTVGGLMISTCEEGVSILDRRDLQNGRKKASDAAYNLASHLLAAKLNLAAGAESCDAVFAAVVAGDALLSSIGFDGSGKFLRPKNAEYAQALELAGMLDDYNNGELCQ